jgi:hypothetical protein
MPDRYSGQAKSYSAPADDGFAIVPNDTTELPEVTRAIYVGTGGNIAVRMASGATLTFANVAGGSLLPARVTRVLAAGTTADQIIGLV